MSTVPLSGIGGEMQQTQPRVVPRRRPTRWTLALLLVGAVALGGCTWAGAGGGTGEGTVTVAIVANPQMRDIQQFTKEFARDHPGVKVRYVTLPENEARARITQDVATKAGQFDVVMIGTYEAPIWGRNGWLTDLTRYTRADRAYDVDDLLPAVRKGLSVGQKLYAVPFYGESSFLMYRKDLFEQAGLHMPAHPTWTQVADFARKLKTPDRAGICLRGLPGWGEQLAPLDTVINTFGGRWYDMNWNAQLTSPATTRAVKFYLDLIKQAGEPGAPNAGFSECLTAYTQGQAAMWYDATVAAGSLEDKKVSKVVGKNGYVAAPVMETKWSGWLWAWSLAIPTTAKDPDAAWEFVSWATSKQYIRLVGERLGWTRVPPGSRQSTYDIDQYVRASSGAAQVTLDALKTVDPNRATKDPVPYTGIQYVQIPEFQDLGTRVSQQFAAVLAGNQSVEDALRTAQGEAEKVADDGYKD
jgi:sorbitol/mannitol transport system substrate-binding protein